jgi:hypothetical protein
MYQCGRCGLTRASSQEPMGLAMPQCKCPFEFVPPVAPQRTWVGLTVEDKMAFLAQDFGGNRLDAMDWAEERLKEKNT